MARSCRFPFEAFHEAVRPWLERERTQWTKAGETLEGAGCFSIVLECVPTELASFITDRLSIPTIGIGAGPSCDGQVLVFHDVLGLYDGMKPKFVRRYAELGEEMQKALTLFLDDIRSGKFPD